MSNEKKDDEMICALTADEHAALKSGLDALPDTPPPREVWQRIRMQGEAEGLLRQRNVLQRPSVWYAGVGVAAAVHRLNGKTLDGEGAMPPAASGEELTDE